tara:strand:+ start:3283 stop:4224 length:942 start_codon:yes stop_codon:yes gene_type:complete
MEEDVNIKLIEALGFSLQEKEGFSLVSLEDFKDFKQAIKKSTKKEGLIVTKEDLKGWGYLVHDFNRMHAFLGYAKDEGYEDVLAQGTLIAGGMEQYVRSLLGPIKELSGKDLIYSAHEIKFSKALYPKFGKIRSNWRLEDALRIDGGISLKVSALNSKGEIVAVSPKITLTEGLYEMNPEKLGEFLSNDVSGKSNFEIKPGERTDYAEFFKKDPKSGIYFMHVGAFEAAGLLDLASRRTGRPEGSYRRLNFKFYNPPELGIFNVLLKHKSGPRPVRDSDENKYVFESLCMQNRKPIVSGEITCYSKSELKLIA